ncbi:hypothetical protein BJ741DRAFT_578129 [Chytriomyces cf. hyalinus JEL632]|nr:hypothetical protein BJ741DRAFT_578129 [Chytriomyces cf. hyalinus JEL632]
MCILSQQSLVEEGVIEQTAVCSYLIFQRQMSATGGTFVTTGEAVMKQIANGSFEGFSKGIASGLLALLLLIMATRQMMKRVAKEKKLNMPETHPMRGNRVDIGVEQGNEKVATPVLTTHQHKIPFKDLQKKLCFNSSTVIEMLKLEKLIDWSDRCMIKTKWWLSLKLLKIAVKRNEPQINHGQSFYLDPAVHDNDE